MSNSGSSEQELTDVHRRWLRACAVYPVLRWQLTMFLGRKLAERFGDPQPDLDQHVPLARLPWFRRGSIPPEERDRLIASMDNDERRIVREIYEDLLSGEGARRAADDRIGQVEDDPVFAQFMLAEQPRRLEASANRELERWRGQGALGTIDARSFLIMGLTLIVAATAAVGAGLYTREWSVPGPEADTFPIPEMVRLPGGSFQMGSLPEEEGRDSDEGPVREVTIQPFEIARTEVTVAEFRAFLNDTGHLLEGNCIVWDVDEKDSAETTMLEGEPWFRPGFPQDGDHPAVCVSWLDAKAYLAWLSNLTGGPAFRLPSEAEWEYAARAGSTTRFFWSDIVKQDDQQICGYANGFDLTARDTGFFPEDWPFSSCADEVEFTAPVGSFRQNGFALFDTSGNVWEWVEDCWHGSYEGAPTDGSAWLSEQAGDCSRRVVRGGSWSDDPQFLRSANRGRFVPDFRGNGFGFRPARTPLPP